MKLRTLAEGDRNAARRRYEFALAVTIVGVVALLLMRALSSAQDAVEEARVQAEVAALRVELLDVLAHREAQGGELPRSANPLRWAGREPAGYLGELDASPSARGVWYFDSVRGELVYRFRTPREARFRLVRGAAAAPVPGTLGGIGLQRLDTPPAGG